MLFLLRLFPRVDVDVGLTLARTDMFYLCLAKTVGLSVLLDSDKQMLESDEANNAKTIVGLQLPSGDACASKSMWIHFTRGLPI